MRSGIARVVTAASVCLGLSVGLVAAGPAIAGQAAPAAGPGSQAWGSRFSGGGDPTANSAAMVLSPAGDRVFVTGESDDGYATVAYSATTGARLWVQRYFGSNTWTDYATAIAVSPAGNTVYVTGTSVGSTPGDYVTIAYNAATGARRWIQRYNAPGDSYDTAFAIAVSAGGKYVFVTGGTGGVITDTDYLTVAYNAGTGTRLWVKRYDGPGKLDDAGIAMTASPAGSARAAVYVTGTSWGTGTGYDYATIAYDQATGRQLWLQRYNGPGNGDDTPLSAAVSPAGKTLFVTGHSAGTTSGEDIATVAYNAGTGARLWVTRYNGPGNGNDQGHAVTVSPGGQTVFVTGHSQGRTSRADDTTIAYNAATGAQRWVMRYNGPGNGDDTGNAVVVNPAGTTVFVTGASTGQGTKFDYATIAFSTASGTRLWVSRYDGPVHGNDAATSVALSPTGRTLFVSGTSDGASGPDFATLAYGG